MPNALSPTMIRRLALTLAIGALAMRMLLPSGFMLSTAPGALPTLVICTGQGAVTMSMANMPGMDMLADAQAQNRGDGQHDDGEKHPCAFAAASAAIDLVAAVHPASTVLGDRADWSPYHRALRPGLGLAAPPPPKTGPPALS